MIHRGARQACIALRTYSCAQPEGRLTNNLRKVVGLLLVSFAGQLVAARSPSASICVAPTSLKRPPRFSPGQAYNPQTLSVKVDKRQALPWPHKESLKIDGLSEQGLHLFIVISDGKPLQSFRFRFSEFRSRNLCFSFDGYQGIQVEEDDNHPWCKCK